MPTWGNTDSAVAKPRFSQERQVREIVRLPTANTTLVGNTAVTLVYNDGFGNNVANIGVAVGQYVYFGSGLAGNGVPGFFASNNQVTAISGNTVILGTAVFANTAPGTIIEFDTAIGYNANTDITYNRNTVLVTDTRLANAVFPNGYSSANLAQGAVAHAGWVQVRTGTGGRAGRVQTEVLVALSNPVAANTLSGNTSNSQTYFSGL
jgi:hypothetical protein